ncbi:hypothetical protein HCA69_03060 [Listeria grandensis]|uniref:Uncharacterized protein n=1 Tax=Listeria grandensis TaxID=1494963 RepID=A0A7X0Y2C2_9LIST|nr:hypothetical protein [Listeria grandensis]MBC1935329.1 hypothetical protein [Listeria grandensis]
MVKFSRALYSKNDDNRFVDVESIPHQANYNDFVNYLFCPDENCNTRLSYVRTREGGHLRKPRGFEHEEKCSYAEEFIKAVSSTIFIEQNGNLSNEGITRRKKDMIDKLMDFLEPQKKVASSDNKNKSTRKVQKIEDGSETGTKKTTISIKYDPESKVDKESLNEEGVTVREPPFSRVLLHQISEKDSYKNLSTIGVIERVEVDEIKELAKIFVSFSDINAVFELPPPFFNNSVRGISKLQLFEYVKILATYTNINKQSLYMNSMCQTNQIKNDNLILYVYDPDFPSFLLRSNVERVFRDFGALVAAITTKAI